MLILIVMDTVGNLLDDEELITVLADTKAKAIDVKEKLLAAADMKKNINDKREQYRPIATRGSILYFSIVDMEQVIESFSFNETSYSCHTTVCRSIQCIKRRWTNSFVVSTKRWKMLKKQIYLRNE